MADERLIAGTATDGSPVAECEIAPDEVGLLPALIEEAAGSGARRLWVHSQADLTPAGFTAVEGYRRLTVGSRPAGVPLPVLDAATVEAVWPRAFAGQWGHKLIDAATARQGAGGAPVWNRGRPRWKPGASPPAPTWRSGSPSPRKLPAGN